MFEIATSKRIKNKRGIRIGKMSKRINQIEIQSMVWFGIIFVIVFSYLPMYGLEIAFRDYHLVNGPTDFVGLKYFKEFLLDRNLMKVLRNTLSINFIAIFIGFPVPIILALLLNELRNAKFKSFAQTMSYLPHFLSWVIFGGLILDMLAPSGVLNHLLIQFGVYDDPINYMADGKSFYLIFNVVGMIKKAGFGSIIYLAAISGVDQEMYEAADIDGCNRFQKMRYITLPAIKGTIVIILIFTISTLLNTGIESTLLLQNPLNLDYSETLDTYVYKIGLGQLRYSYATAVGLLKSVVSVILLVLANFFSKKIANRGLF